MEIYSDESYRTFTEETPGQLTGKEGCLVELTANGTIQLLTTGIAIGVVFQKLQGSSDVTIRMLAKEGTVKVVQAGAIPIGSRVRAKVNDGRVEVGTAGRSIGIKISPTTNGAAGDVIEIIDLVEVIPQTLALTSTDGTAAAAADLAALKAEAEHIGDDVRAIYAKLQAAGVLN